VSTTRRKQHDDHDQIDADHGEQRDKHAAILASWQACDITAKENS
jgi:hypothetical protein